MPQSGLYHDDMSAAHPLSGKQSVVVVGAGAIGLSTAWTLLRHGFDVTIYDPNPGQGALWAAAGMLAPASESHFGEEAIVPLLLDAATEWESFSRDLVSHTGHDIGYRRTGTLLVAYDQGDRAELARVASLQHSLGLDVIELGKAELQDLEPNLAPSIRFGLHVPGDHQVDNRLLLSALLAGIENANGQIRHERVCTVESNAVVLESGERVAADLIVFCPGAQAGQITGVVEGLLPVVRPVKGQILRLQGASLLERTVRATVQGRSVYLVPRHGGGLVVGATVEEKGFDTNVGVGEVFHLLEDARTIIPGIDELNIVDLTAGLRPGVRTNIPCVQRLDNTNVIAAVGHHRNGVLLAPLTAAMILAIHKGDVHQSLLHLERAQSGA